MLLIHDAATPFSREEEELQASLQGRPYLLVQNKIDLLPESSLGVGTLSLANDAVPVSAITGQGLASLRERILGALQARGNVAEAGALNNRRQQQAVLDALAALKAAAEANDAGLPHEILLLDLHAALRSLGSLTGEVTADDILGRIFSTFCIGK